MSFSLSIAGHVDITDTSKNEEVARICKSKGAEVVAALKAIDVVPTNAQFSGPVGAGPIEAPSSEGSEPEVE